MARHPSSQPTEVELQILRTLWDHGPSTVREVHDRVSQARGTGYATTVKMLLVMLDKGLVARDDSVRPQIYRAAVTRRGTQRRVLDDLIRKLYDGSAAVLVQQALSSGRTSSEELTEIRRLLDQLEAEKP